MKEHKLQFFTEIQVNKLLTALGFDVQYGKEYMEHLSLYKKIFNSNSLSTSPDFSLKRSKAIYMQNIAHNIRVDREIDLYNELYNEVWFKNKKNATLPKTIVATRDSRQRKDGGEPLYYEGDIIPRDKTMIELEKNHPGNNIFATDIADFTFCPASYAIKNRYHTEKNNDMVAGSDLHDLNLSINFYAELRNLAKTQLISSRPEFKETRIIFNGAEEGVKPYYSPKEKIACVPDYIFENKYGGKYIVEEKFTTTNREVKKPYPNHLIQVLVYMYALPELKIEAAYLNYMVYREIADKPRIFEFKSFNIEKSDANKRALLDVFQQLKTFTVNKIMAFDSSSLSVNKCAKCSVRKYCFHKTKKYDKLYLDYSKTAMN